MPGVGALGVVPGQPFADLGLCFLAGLECPDVNALIFQRPQQPLDHAVVDPAAAPVHRDFHLGVCQNLREAVRGKLGSLVRIEDLWRAVFGQGIFQRLDTEFGLHRVAEPPGQNLARGPVHDGHQIQKPAPHRDVGDVGAPHLIWPLNHHVFQQIRINLVLRMLLAGVRGLVNRHQLHQMHQTADTMPAAFVAQALHETRHLARPVPRRVQELLVDDLHELQVLGALVPGAAIQTRTRQRQQPALAAHAQIMIPAHHFLPPLPSN